MQVVLAIQRNVSLDTLSELADAIRSGLQVAETSFHRGVDAQVEALLNVKLAQLTLTLGKRYPPLLNACLEATAATDLSAAGDFVCASDLARNHVRIHQIKDIIGTMRVSEASPKSVGPPVVITRETKGAVIRCG